MYVPFLVNIYGTYTIHFSPLFYRALLQKRPIILSILLTKATPYWCVPPDPMNHVCSLTGKYISKKYFAYRSVQIPKILFRGFILQIWFSAQDHAVLLLLLNIVGFFICARQKSVRWKLLYQRGTSSQEASLGQPLNILAWFIGTGCLCIYVHFSCTHIYIYINVCAWIFMYKCIYIYAYVYQYIYIYVYIHIYTCISIYIYIYIYIYICIYIYIYSCIYIYIYIYIYTFMYVVPRRISV